MCSHLGLEGLLQLLLVEGDLLVVLLPQVLQDDRIRIRTCRPWTPGPEPFKGPGQNKRPQTGLMSDDVFTDRPVGG